MVIYLTTHYPDVAKATSDNTNVINCDYRCTLKPNEHYNFISLLSVVNSFSSVMLF